MRLLRCFVAILVLLLFVVGSIADGEQAPPEESVKQAPNEDVIRLEATIEELKKNSESEITSLRNTVDQLNKHIDDLKAENEKLSTANKQLKSTIDSSQSQEDTLANELKNLKKEINGKENTISQQEELIAKQKKTIEDFDKNQADINEELRLARRSMLKVMSDTLETYYAKSVKFYNLYLKEHVHNFGVASGRAAAQAQVYAAEGARKAWPSIKKALQPALDQLQPVYDDVMREVNPKVEAFKTGFAQAVDNAIVQFGQVRERTLATLKSDPRVAPHAEMIFNTVILTMVFIIVFQVVQPLMWLAFTLFTKALYYGLCCCCCRRGSKKGAAEDKQTAKKPSGNKKNKSI